MPRATCLYYQDTNPYWVDMREAMDRFTLSYDYTHLSTFYADLVEIYRDDSALVLLHPRETVPPDRPGKV